MAQYFLRISVARIRLANVYAAIETVLGGEFRWHVVTAAGSKENGPFTVDWDRNLTPQIGMRGPSRIAASSIFVRFKMICVDQMANAYAGFETSGRRISLTRCDSSRKGTTGSFTIDWDRT